VNNEFNKWVRSVINPQAHSNGNNISLDDFSRDGMREYLYPIIFVVEGVTYRWSYGTRKTRGRGMSSHYELWLHADVSGFSKKIATGEWTLAKMRKGLRMIFDQLKQNYYDRGI